MKVFLLLNNPEVFPKAKTQLRYRAILTCKQKRFFQYDFSKSKLTNNKPKMLSPTNTSTMYIYIYPSQTNTGNTQRA